MRSLRLIAIALWLAIQLGAPCLGGETIRISETSWNYQTLGEAPLTLDERVWALKFSADGKSLFAVADSIFRIDWPSKQLRPIWQPTTNETMDRAVFSPDGTHFARLENGRRIHLHETSTGKLLHTLTGSSARAFDAAAWSGDGKLIAIGGLGEIIIYRTADGEVHKRIAQGSTDISAVAWSPDGKWLVAGPNNGNPDEKILLHSLQDNAAPIQLPGDVQHSTHPRFSFSPDSQSLAVHCAEGKGTGSYREMMYFWNIKTGAVLYRHTGPGFNCITHSPDGKLLAASGLNDLLILDARTGKEVFHHRDETVNSHIWSLAFSPDGKVLAYGVDDRIKCFDTGMWQQIDPAKDLRAPVTALAFSTDGRHLVTGGLNGDLVLWDWEKKSPVWRQFSTPGTWGVKEVSLDPLGRWIGVAQNPRHPETRGISMVDFATGKTRKYFSLDLACTAAPLFPKTGSTAFVATTDHALVEWDYQQDRALRTIPIPFLRGSTAGKYHKIYHLEFDSADPKLIRWEATQASGRIHTDTLAESGTLDSNHPNQEADPIPPRSHEFVHNGAEVWSLPSLYQVIQGGGSESPTATNPLELLFFRSTGKKVEVFDLLSLSFIHHFSFGAGKIQAIALSPDGNTLVAATSGGLHYVSLAVKGPSSETIASETLWQIMGSDDHWEAYQAAWALARQPDFLPFLKSRLGPAQEPSADEIKGLQSLLPDGNPQVRQTAARKWLDLGFTLDRLTYETLREGGLPVPATMPPAALSHIVSYVRPVPPIPPLTPLSEHRRLMRAVMILLEDQSPESFRQLQLLATGFPSAPLTAAARKAVAIRTNRVSRQ